MEECRKCLQELLKLKHPEAKDSSSKEAPTTASMSDDLDVAGGMVAGEGLPLMGLSPTENKAQMAAEADLDRITALAVCFM